MNYQSVQNSMQEYIPKTREERDEHGRRFNDKTKAGGVLRALALASALSGCDNGGTSKAENPDSEIVDAMVRTLGDSAINAALPDASIWADSSTVDSSVPDASSQDGEVAVDAGEIIEADAGTESVDQGAGPVAHGTINVTRCPLVPPDLGEQIIHQYSGGPDGERSAQYVDMAAAAERARVEVPVACWHIEGDFDDPAATVEIVTSTVRFDGRFSLPTELEFGAEVLAPFAERTNGSSIGANGHSLHLGSGPARAIEIKVATRLDQTTNGEPDPHLNDEYFTSSIHLEGSDGVEVNCIDPETGQRQCTSPITTFTNTKTFELNTSFLLGDESVVQGFRDFGLQPQAFQAGSWDFYSVNGSYGVVRTINIGCHSEDDFQSAPERGRLEVRTYSPDYQLIDRRAIPDTGDGQYELDAPLEIGPGDYVQAVVLAENTIEGAGEHFRCAVTAVLFEDPNSILAERDAEYVLQPLDIAENPRSWNLVVHGVPDTTDFRYISCGYRQQRGATTRQYYTDSPYLWGGNLDQDQDGTIVPLDETRIFEATCYNSNENEPAYLTSVSFAIEATDFQENYSFRLVVELDGESYSATAEVQPDDDGMVRRLELNFDMPILIAGELSISLRPAEGAMSYPIPPQQQTLLFIERANLTGEVTNIAAVDAEGSPYPLTFQAIAETGQDDNGNVTWSYSAIDFRDAEHPPLKKLRVESAEPYVLITQSNPSPRPEIFNTNDPEVVANGILVYSAYMRAPYEGGRVVEMIFSQTTGKAELGDTIVEVKIGNRVIVVPAYQWDANSFSIILDEDDAAALYDGRGISTNDPDLAESLTNLEVRLRSSFAGITNEGFSVSLIGVRMIAGKQNQPVEVGNDFSRNGRELTEISPENPVRGNTIIIQGNER